MLSYILDDSIVEPKFKIFEDTNDFIKVKLNRSKQIVKIPKRINSELAYLLGVVAGDGHLSIRKRKNSKYPCTQLYVYNNSKTHITKIESLFKEIFDVKTRVFKKSYNNCFVLVMNNKLVWLFFSEILKIQNKKYDLEVPKSVQSKQFFKFFLAGFVDTDGYYDKSNKVYGLTLGGSHYNLLLQIQELCMKFYKIKMIGPYKNTLKRDKKVYFRCELYTSAPFTSQFEKIMPLIEKRVGPTGFEPVTSTV